MLFYWWPIWLLGIIMALITYFDHTRLAIVPDGSKLTETRSDEKGIYYELAVTKPTQSLMEAKTATRTPGEEAFKPRVSQKAWMGPVFCVVLLLTVVITNVPLRGLWSFLVLLLLVVVALVISLVPDGWDSLLQKVGNLHIYINMAGYLFIAGAVFILWAVSVFIFDQRTYMRVTPGQIQVCEHVGRIDSQLRHDRPLVREAARRPVPALAPGILLRRPDRADGRRGKGDDPPAERALDQLAAGRSAATVPREGDGGSFVSRRFTVIQLQICDL